MVPFSFAHAELLDVGNRHGLHAEVEVRANLGDVPQNITEFLADVHPVKLVELPALVADDLLNLLSNLASLAA